MLVSSSPANFNHFFINCLYFYLIARLFCLESFLLYFLCYFVFSFSFSTLSFYFLHLYGIILIVGNRRFEEERERKQCQVKSGASHKKAMFLELNWTLHKSAQYRDLWIFEIQCLMKGYWFNMENSESGSFIFLAKNIIEKVEINIHMYTYLYLCIYFYICI